MKISIRNHQKLNITFEGGEKFTLTPGLYLWIPDSSPRIVRGRKCYLTYIQNIHTDARHKFKESGYFLCSARVLSRIFSSQHIEIL